jgi:hypothetical protein
MRIGTTYDESVIQQEEDSEILEKLSLAGLTSLELVLHPSLMSDTRALALLRRGSELNFSFAYHVPDFIDPLSFDLNLVVLDKGSKSLNTFSEWICKCAASSEQGQLIIHGASDKNRTLRFFDWALEMVEQKNLDLTLLLENTWSSEQENRRFGQTFLDLSLFSKTFDGAPAGLCLDTAHWFRAAGIYSNRRQSTKPEISLLSDEASYPDSDPKNLLPDIMIPWIKRIHVHEADPDSGIDHLGINRTKALTAQLLKPWITLDHEAEKQNTVLSLEVLQSSLVRSGRLSTMSWIDTVMESAAWLLAITH